MKHKHWTMVIAVMLCTILSSCSPEASTQVPSSSLNGSEVGTSQTGHASSLPTVTDPASSGASENPVGVSSNLKSSTAISGGQQMAVTSLKQEVKAADAKEVQDKLEQERKILNIAKDTVEASLVSAGNQARIAAVMHKAMRGEPITIGVIGGSITYGSSASNVAKTSYGPLVAKWWEETFPQSKITFVNAGLGATDSVIGVHRVQPHLLDKNPDFIVIEFSANDSSSDLCAETYENLVRRCLKAKGQPGVLLLHMMAQDGSSAQDIHIPTGKHYQLPMISYKNAMTPLLESGKIEWSKLSPDTVHPNDYGHSVIAYFIKSYLGDLYTNLGSIKTDVPAIPAPRIGDTYEKAQLLTSANFESTKLGSFKVNKNAFVQFKDGWTVTSGTDAIEFKLKNVKNVFLLYNRTPKKKTGKVKATINYKDTTVIDGYFALMDYAFYTRLSAAANAGNQFLTIKPQPEGDKTEFTILGIMVS